MTSSASHASGRLGLNLQPFNASSYVYHRDEKAEGEDQQ
jgi:hypothetical protein